MQVLIIGAGPVGLLLASELQRRGVSYRLVEARARRDTWCKALGISARTLEIFDQLGLLEEVLQQSVLLTAVNTAVNGEVVARVEVGAHEHPYPPLCMPQYATEAILEDHLAGHGGRIDWGTRLTEISPSDGRVVCRLEGPAATETVVADWVVGCDGSHSTVRKAVGIPFEGGHYEQVFWLGDMEVDWPHPHSEVWKLVLREDGETRNVIAVVPIPGNPRRYRLSMAAPPPFWERNAPSAEPSLEQLREVAEKALPPGTRLHTLRWSSHFRISHRIAPRYQQGRVLLAGDAAHIHPPVGGLGMNTGLQDAFNLGWKLAAVARGEAPESLIETYSEERQPVGADVVALTTARMNDSVAARMRNEEEEERLNTQLWVNYRRSTLTVGASGSPGAQPGDRLDYLDNLRLPGVRRPARILDMLRDGRFHLFGYGPRPLEFSAIARTARQRFGDRVRCWFVAPENVSPLPEEGFTILHDPAGQSLGCWGVGPGALLVRPDGHILWRGANADTSFGEAADKVTASPAPTLA
jgi:2-polyprenyl-6-methoxyphenol hydroxylase-like FAD-dependent oxidoreductase